MYSKIIYFLLLLGWLLPSACTEENLPDNPAPEVTINAAQDITRTSATLSGTVKQSANSVTHLYRFRYGTSPEMMQQCACQPENSVASIALQDLTPGTTYYYCLEAGNEKYLIQSPVLSFKTNPNQAPQVEEITFLGQGPISIMLQCAVTDNGGEEISSTGFCYAIEGGEEKELTSPLTSSDNNQWHVRIGGLKKDASYTVRAFAENKIGRTYSEPFNFRTGQAVTILTAGTLPEIMDDEEKYGFAELSITGPLNGTDLRYIREMMGKDIHGKVTDGKLSVLDMTDARIVAGGLSYNETRFTEDNTIGYGMFGELELLEKITLPEETVVIEQDAFRNSKTMKALTIPANTEKVAPSTGCSELSAITVASINRNYSSTDGVMYDKKGESLIWFPEAKSEEEIQFSATLKSIGDFALQKCRVRRIVLPNSLTSIGKQAFYASEMESVVLPDQLKIVSYGLFQECKNLTSVTLGSACELISDFCFDGCTLEHLYVKASIPPVCNEDAFTGATNLFEGCELHVPAESVSIYRNHIVWQQFIKIHPYSGTLNAGGQ